MWSGDKRVSSNHHSFAGFGVNRLVTVSVYYILLVFRNLLLLLKYYLYVSLQAGLVTDLFAECDGELSRFFLLHDVKNNAIFVFLFLLLFQNES